MNGKIIEIDITDLAFDGKAVGHLDGKVIFLNGGLPGERVRAEIVRSKPRYYNGIVHEIMQRCDKRIEAVCEHFSICGGCSWQDLDYNEQLKYKKHQTVDCLARLGHITDVEVADVIGSGEKFFYRNKMEFSFHVTTDESFTLGLHQRGHYDKIFDLRQCHLESQLSNKLVDWIRNWVTRESIPVYDVKQHTGYMRFLVIREGKRTSQTMVNIVTNYGDFPNAEELVRQMTHDFPAVVTIIHNQNDKRSNIAVGEIESILHGPGYIEELLCDKTFRIRANSFFQTNPVQAETLYRTAFEMLQPDPGDRVLDLYCGTGSISILLAGQVSEVLGVELVSDAIRAARENAELNGITNTNFIEANVAEFLKAPPTNLADFHVVIIDPPRAGLHPKALKRLLSLQPEKLLYISCNPSTFARDARRIIDSGYQLPKVQPVDMFPHTMHIELVGLFSLTEDSCPA